MEGVFRMLLRYSNGLCLTTYLAISDTPVAQSSVGVVGLSSIYAFQVPPAATILFTIEVPCHAMLVQLLD